MDFPSHLLPTLTALIDRIIPPDDFPSASQNAVLDYFRKQWPTAFLSLQDFLAVGLQQLDAESQLRHQRPFAQLSESDQDALLLALDRGEARAPWPGENPGPPHARYWFNRLIDFTAEAYYADPSNAANPQESSWRMIGYKK